MLTAKPQLFSLGIHVVLLALLLLAGSLPMRTELQTAAAKHFTPLIFEQPKKMIQSRGGGSNRTVLPARHGSPPPMARRTFIPPVANPHPQLALPVTIAFDIPTQTVSSNIGDPLSRLAKGALGINGTNGIGNHGCCGGIGESPSGAPGIGAVHRGRGVSPPQLIYKVEPEFSEEARKAKYQGVVVLRIIVDANGAVRNIRVEQGLGLGLDEKAAEAVSRWRFRPGFFDGQPVATEALVQVRFQLL